jgi:hypothetical protein
MVKHNNRVTRIAPKDLNGKAGTNNASLTSKWSRRIHIHSYRCTITLYSISKKTRRVGLDTEYIPSSKECVARSMYEHQLQQNYHIARCVPHITPQAKKGRTKSPTLNLQDQCLPTELEVHHRSYLIKFIPLLIKQFKHASRTLRSKKHQHHHAQKACHPSLLQNGCHGDLRNRPTHPNPWRKP